MCYAGWDGVFPFALEGICAVEAEAADADKTFGWFGRWAGDLVVDEEGGGGAGAVLDVWVGFSRACDRERDGSWSFLRRTLLGVVVGAR